MNHLAYKRLSQESPISQFKNVNAASHLQTTLMDHQLLLHLHQLEIKSDFILRTAVMFQIHKNLHHGVTWGLLQHPGLNPNPKSELISLTKDKYCFALFFFFFA